MKVLQTRRLDAQDHRALTLWAADCAERVLASFEDKYPQDAILLPAFLCYLTCGEAAVDLAVMVVESEAARSDCLAGP
ncbi:MAG TPA: hypothetical protein VF791_17945 [Pyrinomonadaceae bacterium]